MEEKETTREKLLALIAAKKLKKGTQTYKENAKKGREFFGCGIVEAELDTIKIEGMELR